MKELFEAFLIYLFKLINSDKINNFGIHKSIMKKSYDLWTVPNGSFFDESGKLEFLIIKNYLAINGWNAETIVGLLTEKETSKEFWMSFKPSNERQQESLLKHYKEFYPVSYQYLKKVSYAFLVLSVNCHYDITSPSSAISLEK